MCVVLGQTLKRFMGYEVLIVFFRTSQSMSEWLSQDYIIELMSEKCPLAKPLIGSVMCVYANPVTYLFQNKHRHYWS